MLIALLPSIAGQGSTRHSTPAASCAPRCSAKAPGEHAPQATRGSSPAICVLSPAGPQGVWRQESPTRFLEKGPNLQYASAAQPKDRVIVTAGAEAQHL